MSQTTLGGQLRAAQIGATTAHSDGMLREAQGPPSDTIRFSNLLDCARELDPLEVSIINTAAFNRLRGVGQSSLCPLVESLGLDDGSGQLRRSRAQHSLEARNFAVHVSNALHLPEREALLLRVVMLVHDIGQPALFSHLGERILARHEPFDHDVQTITELCSPESDITAAILEHAGRTGITLGDVIAVLEQDTTQTHALGFLAREIVDRISYLLADIGGSRLRADIKEEMTSTSRLLLQRGLVRDADGSYWIRQPKDAPENPFQTILGARNIFYSAYNQHPAAVLFERLMGLQLDHVIANKGMRPIDLVRMTDFEAVSLLAKHGLPGVPLPSLVGDKVGNLDLGRHYKTLRWAAWQNLREPNEALSDLQQILSAIHPVPGEVLVCKCQDISKGKNVRVPIRYATGLEGFQPIELQSPPGDLKFFVVVANTVPADVQAVLTEATHKFLMAQLKKYAPVQTTELLWQISMPELFLNPNALMGGLAGGPTKRRK